MKPVPVFTKYTDPSHSLVLEIWTVQFSVVVSWLLFFEQPKAMITNSRNEIIFLDYYLH